MAMDKFLDITDFSREGLREALNKLTVIKGNRSVFAEEFQGKTVANITLGKDKFKEEYAMTSAVKKMGGSAVNYELSENESLKDAVMKISAIADVINISHCKKGAARAVSLYSKVPVINSGDGGRAYPLQTLSDLASVWVEKNHVSNMKIGFLGDFSNNVFVRGIMQCLNLYKGNEFFFVSVNGKPIPDDFINIMDRREKDFIVYDNIFEVLPELDVLYMTEVTKESFETPIQYNSRKHKFTLDERMLMSAKEDLVILHPFPRGDELPMSIDSDSRAKYIDGFERYIDACMAIISFMSYNRVGSFAKSMFEESTHEEFCGKEDCITSTEDYLPHLFYELSDGRLICKYCGQELKK